MEEEAISYRIAILPWVVLREPIELRGVRFISLLDKHMQVRDEFAEYAEELIQIKDDYVDVTGKPISNCTVICMPERIPVWNLENDDIEKVRLATDMLSLAGISATSYFSSATQYTNASSFKVFFQRFTKPLDSIVLTARRRDGTTKIAGYEHGEIKITIPVECWQDNPVEVDSGLANGLNMLPETSAIFRRLLPAISFFNLANTDSSVMLPEAELILSASAFEQLLGTSNARGLYCKIGMLLKAYGNGSAEDAAIDRSGINFTDKYRPQQQAWFPHKKWAEEFHNLRSKLVHGESTEKRGWGWNIHEHLLISRFSFPLVVKLCLARERCYTLTDKDESDCRSIDKLLIETNWKKPVDESIKSNWQNTIDEQRSDDAINDAFNKAIETVDCKYNE